jgi:hypothetical protein
MPSLRCKSRTREVDFPASFLLASGMQPLLACSFVAALAFAGSLAAQSTAVQIAPPAVAAAFDASAATLQSLTMAPVAGAPSGTLGGQLVFAGAAVALQVQPFDVRGPRFTAFARSGRGLEPLPTAPCSTYRGAIVGEPGSAVAASEAGGSWTLYVRRASGEVWVVQPLTTVSPSAAPTLHVVHRAADGVPVAANCRVSAPGLPLTPSPVGLDAVYVCELAIEADHPLFLLNGSNVTATQNDVLAVVNAVDLIFRTDVQINLQVAQLIVDVTPDPYTTSVASQLLTEFQNYWNANYGALGRDVAHLFSGRQLGAASGGTIGFANVGVVCDPTLGYGVSETRWSANFAYRGGITAHELGHNCNATHCDGQAACNIMCSLIGGCSGSVSAFGPNEQAQILAFQQLASCLDLQPTPPQITGVTPVQIATVNPPLVTISGSGLLGTTVVTVASQPVTNGIQVLSDNQLQFTPPAGLPLAFHPVSVSNAAGTSNAAVLWYRPSNPCQVLVPTTLASGAALQWTMGGWNGDDAFLVASLLNTQSPVLGFPVLDNFLLLWSGPLDARGMATLSVPVPSGLLTGLTIRWQLLDAFAGTPSLRSVSSVVGTTFQ